MQRRGTGEGEEDRFFLGLRRGDDSVRRRWRVPLGPGAQPLVLVARRTAEAIASRSRTTPSTTTSSGLSRSERSCGGLSSRRMNSDTVAERKPSLAARTITVTHVSGGAVLQVNRPPSRTVTVASTSVSAVSGHLSWHHSTCTRTPTAVPGGAGSPWRRTVPPSLQPSPDSGVATGSYGSVSIGEVSAFAGPLARTIHEARPPVRSRSAQDVAALAHGSYILSHRARASCALDATILERSVYRMRGGESMNLLRIGLGADDPRPVGPAS